MVTILGGGLGGLSAGFYLSRKTIIPITLYETGIRLGGWIKTESHRDQGFIFEQGPRTIRPKGIPGANTLELIEDLNIPINVIPSSHPAALRRLIYANNRLCMLPNNVNSLFRTLPPFKKPIIRSLLKDLFTKKTKIIDGDESVYDFALRRFGKDIADYAISPMICGICAGDAKEISVRFLMNDIFEKEQKYGGVLKGLILSKFQSNKTEKNFDGLFGDRKPSLYERAVNEKWSMYGVEGGLEKLPITLGNYLKEKDVKMELSVECREIIFENQVAYLYTSKSRTECEHVVSTIPSFRLAKCVQQQHPELAELLMSINYVDVAVINLQYPTKDILKEQAFGFLVPPVENLPILGVIFDSCCFDMENNTVLTVMMGGKWFDQYFGDKTSQRDLLNIALKYTHSILGINIEPKCTRVNILTKCIPQYTIGHQQRVAKIRNYISETRLPLSICGAAYDGVGINDVILSARNEINKIPFLNI